MPKLSEIAAEHHGFIELDGLPWFTEAANHKGLAEGGVYLLSGPPGAGKTTLALQIAVDLACHGHKVLFLALEQSPADLKYKVERQVFPHRRTVDFGSSKASYSLKEGLKKAQQGIKEATDEERVEQYFSIDSNVSGMEALPDFLARQVLGQPGQYADTRLIIVDSIQGLGTAPTSSKPYARLFEFNRWAKDHGITVILVGHITKGGAIAGPRSLEHNVDCVLYLRKAMRLRPLFVPKNRFGPERHEPLSLIMDDHGCLVKSKHVKAKASQAFGYLPGAPGDLIEVQALVKLPKYGDKPGIKAPYLPRQKLTQLVGIVSSIQDIDISDLTFEINCAIPGGRPYFQTLDLPLAVSMLSSYFQRAIPVGSLFIGEVDLFQEIRPLSPLACEQVAELLSAGDSSPVANWIQRIYVSKANREALAGALAQKGVKVDVHGISSLEALVRTIWPDVMEA
jgi:DNA repair protein RadA/Sms